MRNKIIPIVLTLVLATSLFASQATPLPRQTINQNGYTLDCKGQVYAGITVNGDNNKVINCRVQDSIGNIGGIAVNGDNNQILNNDITGACMAGVIVRGNGNLIQGNEISRSRQCGGSGADADGIRVFNNGNRIIGNDVRNISLAENPTAHIDCIQSWGALTNTLIQDNYCDTAHAGVQIDSSHKVENITIIGNRFIASRPLNVYGNELIVKNNVFVGRIVTGFAGAFVSFRDSTNITFTNNIIFNTTDGVITGTGATKQGGNNVFWNDSGIPPRRDSGYNGTPSNLNWKSDKWQTINPMLDKNYFTTNPLVCYAGLGCIETFPPTSTVTVTATRIPTSTITPTQTITPTATAFCIPALDVWVCNKKP